jgi:AAA15 family ATPase/GTPase
MIQTLAIENYRSLLNLVMPLGNLNVISGPNASGKSNLYRALRFLSETAQGGVIKTRSKGRVIACKKKDRTRFHGATKFA